MDRVHVLPLPSGGKINRIIALADIHVRAGDKEESRYEEYMYTLAEMVEMIKHMEDRENTCAVICGDLLHNRGMIGACGMKMLSYMLKELSDMMPTYMICGNHDINPVHQATSMDMIEGVMSMLEMQKNLYYMKETGIYVADRVGFSVVSVRDVMERGATTGLVERLPEYPSGFPPETEYKIALFHGTVNGTKMQSYTSASGGVPIEWFSLFDLAILGDIHLAQTHEGPIEEELEIRFGRGLSWGYPGSLIQQNFGESPTMHGYQIYDLEGKRIEHVPVSQHTVRLKMVEDGGELKIYMRGGARLVTVNRLMEMLGYIPQRVMIRLPSGTRPEDTREIYTKLKEKGVKEVIYSGYTPELRKRELVGENEEQIGEMERVMNDQGQWLHYLKMKEWEAEWEEMVMNPRTMIPPNPIEIEGIAPTIYEKAITRTKEIVKLSEMVEIDYTPPRSYRICRVYARDILCYDELNLDISKMRGHVVQISGSNGSGKSSIFEIIVCGIYGHSMGSRQSLERKMMGQGTTIDAVSLVSNNKEKRDKKPKIEIEIERGGERWRIEREFKKRGEEYRMSKCMMQCMTHDRAGASNKTAVDQLVEKMLGTSEYFMMTSMMTQNQDSSFISLPVERQMEHINRILQFDAMKAYMRCLVEAIKTHESLDRDMVKVLSALDMNRTRVDREVYDELEKRKERYKRELEEVEDELSGLSYTMYPTIEESWKRVVELETKMGEVEEGNDIEGERSGLLMRRGVLETQRMEGYEVGEMSIKWTEIDERRERIEREIEGLREKQKELEEQGEEMGKELEGMEIESTREDLAREGVEEMLEEIMEELRGVPGGIERTKEELMIMRERREFYEVNVEMEVERIEEMMEWEETEEEMKEEVERLRVEWEASGRPKMVEGLEEEDMRREDKEEILREVLARLGGSEGMKLEDMVYEIRELEGRCEGMGEEVDMVSKEGMGEEVDMVSKEELRELEERKEEVKERRKQVEMKQTMNDQTLEEVKEELEGIEKRVKRKMKVEREYRELRGFLEDIDTMGEMIEGKKEDIKRRGEEIERLSKEMEKYPYNDECEACRAQPGRCQLREMEERMMEDREELGEMEEEFRKKRGRKRIDLRRKKMEELEKEKENIEKDEKRWVDLKERRVDMERLGEEREVLNRKESELRRELERKREMRLLVLRRWKEAREEEERWGLVKKVYPKWRYDNAKKRLEWRRRWRMEVEYRRLLEELRLGELWSDKARWELVMKERPIAERRGVIMGRLREVEESLGEMRRKEEEMRSEEKRLGQYKVEKELEWVINRLEEYERLRQTKVELEVAKRVKKEAPKWHELVGRRKELRAEMEEIVKEMGTKMGDRRKAEEEDRVMMRMEGYQREVRERLELMGKLHVSMEGYVRWLYEEEVIPRITGKANEVISRLTDRRIKVRGEIGESGKLRWDMEEGGRIVRMHKTSGFERFVVGMGMGVSIRALGGNMEGEKYVDEGFTGCDAEHMERVGGFVESMLREYESVILVTHLERMEREVEWHLQIESSDGRSRLSNVEMEVEDMGGGRGMGRGRGRGRL